MTEACVRLVSCETLAAVHDWPVPQGSRITVATANSRQVLPVTLIPNLIPSLTLSLTADGCLR